MSNLPNNLPVEITYYLEIPIKVTCTVSKGYPATHTDPGCPDEICDPEYSYENINELIKEEKISIEEAVWEEVSNLCKDELRK